MSHLLSFPSPPTHLLLNSFQTGFCSQHVTDSACQVLPGHPSANPMGVSVLSHHSTPLTSDGVKHSFFHKTLHSTAFSNEYPPSSLVSLSQCPLPAPHFLPKLKMRVSQGLTSGSPLCLRVSCAHLSLKAASMPTLLSVSMSCMHSVVRARERGWAWG